MAMQDHLDDIERRLWNANISPQAYTKEGEKYQAAVLEQYKIYVEMADRISQRRGLTNTFFLTLNTAIFTTIGVFWEHKPQGQAWWLVFLLAILLGECFSWFYILRSYRLLNAAKFRVVGALERRLPASPYWSAEWGALGEGNDRKKYWPLGSDVLCCHLCRWLRGVNCDASKIKRRGISVAESLKPIHNEYPSNHYREVIIS